MQMQYGQTSEKTNRIRKLVDRVSLLGCSDDKDIENVREILQDIEQNYSDIDDVFVTASKSLLENILEDGQITEEEKELLSKYGALFDDPVSNESVTGIKDRAFVLTGDFEVDGGKGAVKSIIEESGGFVRSKASSKTDYVVVGNEGSDAWGYGSFGGKIKSALELILTQTSKVKIVSEDAFFDYVKSGDSDAAKTLEEQQERFQRQKNAVKVVDTNFQGLTEGQQKFLDLVDDGHNVYLAGLGGTGKSYVLDLLIKRANEVGRNVIACAPTGIAALNIGGSTIHRVLGIGPGKTLDSEMNPWVDEDSALLSCDLLIVDEISMCRMDLFDYLSLALKRAAELRDDGNQTPCQLVVVGDFSQLPPVLPKEDAKVLEENYGYEIGGAYPFMGREWDTWNFQKIELTETIRQRDEDFARALNSCRVGDTSGLKWIDEHACETVPKDAVTLCGLNEEADRINAEELRKLPTESMLYQADVQGEVKREDMPTLTTLELKPGARVMALANKSQKTYMNGSLGTVKACHETYVDVKFDGGRTVQVDRHTWEIRKPVRVGDKVKSEVIGTFEQIPLKLAYAITIHKAQGQTFEAVSIYPRCWDPGQLYTALSRVTSIEGLHLAYHCSNSFLIASKEVLDFYDEKPLEKKKVAPSKSTAKRAANEKPPAAEDSVKQEPAKHEESTNKDGKEKLEAPFINMPANINSYQIRAASMRVWTKEEEDFLLEHLDRSNQELADALYRTPKAIERKKAKLLAQQKKGKKNGGLFIR